MRPRRFLCLIVAIAAAGRAEHLPLRAWTTADGLAHNHINRIRQDSRGFLWFGTDEGLSRFDGSEFVNYTVRDGVPHPWVNDFLETHDGEYWIASDGGVSRFVPRHKPGEAMFVTWKPGPNPDAVRVNALVEDSAGTIWCATYDGLYRLERKGHDVKFAHMDLGFAEGYHEKINNLAFDSDGSLWLAGSRHGLFRRFADGRAEMYTERDGLPEAFIDTLLHDRDGRWWIGTRGSGICSLVRNPSPGHGVTDRCYSTADGLPHNDVRSILRTSAGTLLIGTYGGLSEFHPEAPATAKFRNYHVANGLTANQIYRLAEDRDGNLWIGTRADGIMRLAREGFVTFGETDGFRAGTFQSTLTETPEGSVCQFGADDPGTPESIPGTNAFIQCLQSGRFRTVRLDLTQSTLRAQILHWFLPGALPDRLGEWWATTGFVLVRFPAGRIDQFAFTRPSAVYRIPSALGNMLIHLCYEDRNGDIWCGAEDNDKKTEAEVMVRRERSNGSWSQYPMGLGKSRIWALAEDPSGMLWAGSGAEDGGLLRYRGGRFESLPAGAGWFAGGVNAIYPDPDGPLWVASSRGGLVRVNDPDSSRPRFVRYTKTEGMASNEILSLSMDRWGRVYAGLNQGVDRLDARTGSVKHFTAADGLVRGTIEHAFRDHQGQLWFSSDQGISRLIPSAEPAPPPAVALVTGISIMGERVRVSELGETFFGDLELAPQGNQMDIDFLAPNFRAGTAVRYQYRFDGANRAWSAPSSSRTIRLASLAPGSYRLLVRAITSNSVISPQPAMVAFRVLAPVWRRWWFIALASAAFGLALYGLHLYRLRHILAVERIRTRIAADLHDDIGASLSHISVLGELARSEVARLTPGADMQPVGEPLARISSVSGELIDSLSDIVWAINPRKDGLSDLSQRMREFAEGVLAPRDIEFRLFAEGIDQDRTLGIDTRRNLFLIFKECVNNIVRHSGATRVDCDLRTERGNLILALRDNGKGFDAANGFNGKGNGLASMRRRAKEMGGELEIVSSDGRGVVVTIRIPVRNQGRKLLNHSEVT
jgi:signal transduction histidine kinase/ligand-binding sensor domain-containing protein